MRKLLVTEFNSLDGPMQAPHNQQYFRENLKLGPEGETGPANDLRRRYHGAHRWQHYGQANVLSQQARPAREGSV
ncbi:MAG: hypothetical protein DWQ09_14145 [Proteobacteria bacterium]|nr:MAG: hypothetical protein DWQ09_14145 [Pseudomonadota bacterium]